MNHFTKVIDNIDNRVKVGRIQQIGNEVNMNVGPRFVSSIGNLNVKL